MHELDLDLPEQVRCESTTPEEGLGTPKFLQLPAPCWGCYLGLPSETPLLAFVFSDSFNNSLNNAAAFVCETSMILLFQ